MFYDILQSAAEERPVKLKDLSTSYFFKLRMCACTMFLIPGRIHGRICNKHRHLHIHASQLV